MVKGIQYAVVYRSYISTYASYKYDDQAERISKTMGLWRERERGEKEKDQPGESQRQELQLRVTEVFEINLV